ncbi:MAG TPA: efflux RND transporter periplasmic adaptor subunit [Pseudomonadales bacterium]|nr:efflux RND transporter periplasmic adaptor subunit [Pseudomonadales bacterium]
MKKLKTIILPVLILVASVGIYQVLHATKPEPEKKEDAPRPLSLFVESVRQVDKTLNVQATGEVRARNEIDVVAQVSGRIVAMSDAFTEGSAVSPGEVLIEIDDRDYRVAVASAEARVAEAEVRLEQATADADVARRLLIDRVNPTALALKKPQVAQAKAALKAAQVELQRAQLDLERTKLTVPFNGRVKSRMAGLGQFVTPGTPLGRVFATDQVEVRLALTDAQLRTLGKHMGFVADSEQEAPRVVFSNTMAGSTHYWHGYLKSIDAAVDSHTRSIYALAVLDAPYHQDGEIPMAVGMYVEASIAGREVSQATLIPRSALRPGNIVFTIEDGVLRRNSVDVIFQSDDFALVDAGVQPGQDVVVSPIRNPIDGMAVEGRYLDASNIANGHVQPNDNIN